MGTLRAVDRVESDMRAVRALPPSACAYRRPSRFGCSSPRPSRLAGLVKQRPRVWSSDRFYDRLLGQPIGFPPFRSQGCRFLCFVYFFLVSWFPSLFSRCGGCGRHFARSPVHFFKVSGESGRLRVLVRSASHFVGRVCSSPVGI